MLAIASLLPSCAMAKEKVLLWPAIQGQILNDGKPVSGLALTQILYWNYEENSAPPRTISVSTDEDGRFIFPVVTGEISVGLLTKLLHQPGISLSINTHFGGRSVNLYAAANSSYSHANGFEAVDLMVCDLGKLEEFDGRLIGNCEVRAKQP